jgi:hypothetical protein
MATAVNVSIAALLIGSLLAASLGPPPARPIGMGVRVALLLAGLGCYAVAAVTLTAGAIAAGLLALALASELLCAVGWLGRGDSPGTDEDDGGGGGGGGGRGPKPPPLDWDWDAFEQAFRRYARERDRQPI